MKSRKIKSSSKIFRLSLGIFRNFWDYFRTIRTEFCDCFWTVRVESSGLFLDSPDVIFKTILGVFGLYGNPFESKIHPYIESLMRLK